MKESELVAKLATTLLAGVRSNKFDGLYFGPTSGEIERAVSSAHDILHAARLEGAHRHLAKSFGAVRAVDEASGNDR